MVILPDWYRGKMQGLDEGMEKVFTFIKEQTNWDALKRDWLEKIKPYAQRHGAKTYGTIGETRFLRSPALGDSSGGPRYCFRHLLGLLSCPQTVRSTRVQGRRLHASVPPQHVSRNLSE